MFNVPAPKECAGDGRGPAIPPAHRLTRALQATEDRAYSRRWSEEIRRHQLALQLLVLLALRA
jgi:hypothetical protein